MDKEDWDFWCDGEGEDEFRLVHFEQLEIVENKIEEKKEKKKEKKIILIKF